jgi:hypothetical protein
MYITCANVFIIEDGFVVSIWLRKTITFVDCLIINLNAYK